MLNSFYLKFVLSLQKLDVFLLKKIIINQKLHATIADNSRIVISLIRGYG